MELARLIEALANPAAYPHAVDRVEVRQTHISVVFLAGSFVYKIKKPVRFDFLDFSALERRRHFCDEEVRLNRRLAPDVYLGVVPVALTETGLRIEGPGEAVEWAVKMQRLPEHATFEERVKRGDIFVEMIEALARRIAAFHASAQTNTTIAAFGRFDAVARNLRDIYTQSRPQIGTTVSQPVFDRLFELNEQALARLRPLIEDRAADGKPRDCHGDLHLDHVYAFPDRAPPGDLVIIDCIEFNERFRYIDPVADMAFAAMDFAFHGRRDLARAFADAYFRAAGDDQGRPLLPLYTAYRATVRGSVEGLKLAEKEVAAAERPALLQKARAYWLLALTVLEQPERKPCLVLVGGLPGTGKSTLARGLSERANFSVIRSDVVRKELAGLPSEQPSATAFRRDLYTAEWNNRTYAECLRRAEELLFAGKRVLVDATFREEARRRMFLETALRWGVPGLVLIAKADAETVRRRLSSRKGDASDADLAVYQHLVQTWEQPGPATTPRLCEIDCGGSAEQAMDQAVDALNELAAHEFSAGGLTATSAGRTL
jgi:aminoglycoside phosphotransferase family enzyme/predicted kinase